MGGMYLIPASLSSKLTSTYYFTHCKASFVAKTLGDTVGREGAMESMELLPLWFRCDLESIPLTR
jgi:hypothetical protein